MKRILYFLALICCISCNTGSTEVERFEIIGRQYEVLGYDNSSCIVICEIEGHEYLINVYSDTFIHSPNCKCNK